MSDKNLPAISKQVTELVLAGSLEHAEKAFAEAAEIHGDLAVVEVLQNIPPHVTALHMSGFECKADMTTSDGHGLEC